MVLTVLVLFVGEKMILVAYFDRSRLDSACEYAPIVETVHVLNREAERLIERNIGHVKRVQSFEHRRTSPPGRVGAQRGDVCHHAWLLLG